MMLACKAQPIILLLSNSLQQTAWVACIPKPNDSLEDGLTHVIDRARLAFIARSIK